MQMVKQLGRWRSDMVAQGYIENSMHNREMMYNGVIRKTATTDNHSMPSTSAQNTAEPENDDSDLHVNWLDFDEDFTVNDVDPTPSTVVKSAFENQGNLQPPTHGRRKNDEDSENQNQAAVQPPITCKRKKNDEDSSHQNFNVLN
ncbi:uncharacterized protein LOC107227667 [Neodiprion lecontei]|uniref:Uncharacterized protein LOC107227667 n=1 Tax=Neodiprion lecontei TaxID=441921 RepID=A0ABM3GF63_NEOLC|nr:uncharacterized protein LOC107227667 [Neodiprion lecontei]XP_046598925.1 uncharacterized protein LOC107227667 [Neodiprion lecontei]